jgi:hypothetical protein
MCPVHIQRLILLLIQRRSKEFHLTCGGLFIASFECFATVNTIQYNIIQYMNMQHTQHKIYTYLK